MVINIRDHLPYCYSADDGAVIKRLIDNEFQSGCVVTISFHGVSEVTSSFVNGAFVALLDSYSYDFIRSHLNIVSARHQVRDMISRRFRFELSRLSAA